MLKQIMDKIHLAKDPKKVESINALDIGMAEWSGGAVKVEVDEDKDVEVAGNQRDETELFEDNFDAI